MSNELKYGGPDEIPQVEATCSTEIFENEVRKIGVVEACFWFGYDSESETAFDVRNHLCIKSGMTEFLQSDNNKEVPF